jgi:hypothetical protein
MLLYFVSFTPIPRLASGGGGVEEGAASPFLHPSNVEDFKFSFRLPNSPAAASKIFSSKLLHFSFSLVMAVNDEAKSDGARGLFLCDSTERSR